MKQAIANLISRHRAKEAEWYERERRSAEEHLAAQARKATDLLPCLKRASARHYRRWLSGYLERGGEPTHFYDYSLPRDYFYVATKDFAMFPMFGAGHINVIVPAGVKCDLSEGTGHCSVYFMDGFTAHTPGFVPVYGDTIV